MVVDTIGVVASVVIPFWAVVAVDKAFVIVVAASCPLSVVTDNFVVVVSTSSPSVAVVVW